MSLPFYVQGQTDRTEVTEVFDSLLEAAKRDAFATLYPQLRRFDPQSAIIMLQYVFDYTSAERPSASSVYRRYKASIARLNEERLEQDGDQLPTLSRSIFKMAIESLDPFFVFLSRYGARAAQRYLARKTSRYRDTSDRET